MNSWLIRLAEGNAVSPHSLCADFQPSGRLLRNGIDIHMAAATIAALAAKSNSTLDEVRERTLEPLFCRLLVAEPKDAAAVQHWILPVATFGRERGGQMFCPECLAEHGQRHYRRSWRLGFMTICDRHGRLLEDACPHCGHAKALVGAGHDPRFEDPESLLTHCLSCGNDLRVGWDHQPLPRLGQDRPLWNDALDLQRDLEKALAEGWANIPGIGPIHSNLLLEGVHQILKVLAGAALTERLNMALLSFGLGDRLIPRGDSEIPAQFELMGVAKRNTLMGVAAWLLNDWPDRFVSLAREAKIPSKVLLQDNTMGLPFWYVDPIREHLTVKFAAWRDPGRSRVEQISYRALAARKFSSRLVAREARLGFIRSNPFLVSDLAKLARSMREAGLYSPNSCLFNIRKNLGKLVRAAFNQSEWWRMAGAPVGAGKAPSKK